MRYQIKQRLLAVRPTFDIANESGEPILVGEGKLFVLAAEVVIRSLSGEEFVRVKQQLFSWRPRFEITQQGRPLATVARRWTLRPRYTIGLAGGGELLVAGSLFEHEFRFLAGEEPVALVSRAMWSLRDTYGVDVFRPEYDAVVLAVVIAIDSVRTQRERSAG
ncbi:hypothetical protein [Botrimarina sp.]|uniref:LURP-one-related/scramblase family protein n=1 Tax=Botrimarina sp. TaxID=2795802 RepID=UPI0032EFFFE2